MWLREALNKDFFIIIFFSQSQNVIFAGTKGPLPAPSRGGGDETAAGSSRGNSAVLLITGDFLNKKGNDFMR